MSKIMFAIVKIFDSHSLITFLSTKVKILLNINICIEVIMGGAAPSYCPVWNVADVMVDRVVTRYVVLYIFLYLDDFTFYFEKCVTLLSVQTDFYYFINMSIMVNLFPTIIKSILCSPIYTSATSLGGWL